MAIARPLRSMIARTACKATMTLAYVFHPLLRKRQSVAGMSHQLLDGSRPGTTR